MEGNVMGWSNFILIHKDKIALECSRHFDSSGYIDNHEADLLDKFNAFTEEESDSEMEDISIKELSIGDVKTLLTAYELVRQYDDETFFYLLLKARYGKVEVVHESKVPVGYKKIARDLE
jgi:hypothetical protein